MVVAALYAVPTAMLLSYTWHRAIPKYHGYDWFWVAILTFPWSPILTEVYNTSVGAAVIVGIALNTALIYLFGTLLTCLRKRDHR
jgi:hypothetical protein